MSSVLAYFDPHIVRGQLCLLSVVNAYTVAKSQYIGNLLYITC